MAILASRLFFYVAVPEAGRRVRATRFGVNLSIGEVNGYSPCSTLLRSIIGHVCLIACIYGWMDGYRYISIADTFIEY